MSLQKIKSQSALSTRTNARDLLANKTPVYANPPVSSDAPDNQDTRGLKVEYNDRLQYEYNTSVINTPTQAFGTNLTQLEPTSILGKSRRRRYLLIQNNSVNSLLYLTFGQGASVGVNDYIVIPTGTSIELPFAPNNEVSVYAVDEQDLGFQQDAVISILTGSIAE